MKPESAIDETTLRAVAQLVEDRFGIASGRTPRIALEPAVDRARLAIGAATASELLARAAADDASALDALADALTIGETYFFRDPAHFQALRERMLPEAMARSAAAPVRIWSAGCASGEEAYSIAITVLEALGAAAARRVEIVATDVSEANLARARAAEYPPWSFRGVSEEARSRWFVARGARLSPRDEVRALVRFERFNLVDAASPWPRGIDVVFCRNVLIYFDAARVEATLRGFAASLDANGWLVLGPSDPRPSPDAMASVQTAFGTFLRPPQHGVRRAATPGGVLARAGTGRERAQREDGRDRSGRADFERPRLEVPALRRVSSSVTRSARLSTPRAAPIAPPRAARTPLDEARLLADRGELVEAMARIEGVLGASPSAEAFVARATLRSAAGDHASAIADAERAVFLDRSLAIAHAVLATARAATGDVSGARRAARSARRRLVGLGGDSLVPHAGDVTVRRLEQALDGIGRTRIRRGGAPT